VGAGRRRNLQLPSLAVVEIFSYLLWYRIVPRIIVIAGCRDPRFEHTLGDGRGLGLLDRAPGGHCLLASYRRIVAPLDERSGNVITRRLTALRNEPVELVERFGVGQQCVVTARVAETCHGSQTLRALLFGPELRLPQQPLPTRFVGVRRQAMNAGKSGRPPMLAFPLGISVSGRQ
jgi:hypothetical protein